MTSLGGKRSSAAAEHSQILPGQLEIADKSEDSCLCEKVVKLQMKMLYL